MNHMASEGRLTLLLWLLVLAAGLVVTIGLPAAFTVLTDTVQLALGAISRGESHVGT